MAQAPSNTKTNKLLMH